jgi:hypothetical protein
VRRQARRDRSQVRIRVVAVELHLGDVGECDCYRFMSSRASDATSPRCRSHQARTYGACGSSATSAAQEYRSGCTQFRPNVTAPGHRAPSCSARPDAAPPLALARRTVPPMPLLRPPRIRVGVEQRVDRGDVIGRPGLDVEHQSSSNAGA